MGIVLRRRLRLVLLPALAGALLAGCASEVPGVDATSCRNFVFSLAVTTGGEESPVAAAVKFAENSSDYDLPNDGWTAGPVSRGGADVHHGRTTLSTVQGTDGTWFVDGGTCV